MLSSAAALLAIRRVSARQGWEGEKVDFLSILLRCDQGAKRESLKSQGSRGSLQVPSKRALRMDLDRQYTESTF